MQHCSAPEVTVTLFCSLLACYPGKALKGIRDKVVITTK